MIPVKNLAWLIERFKEHPEHKLSIIGFGAEEENLRRISNDVPNVEMLGAVNNKDLPSYYQNADIFILPSITETWGVVVEEALNNGIPVMASHMVGSADDLIIAKDTGVVFKLNDTDDFEAKLTEITDVENYNRMCRNISKIDFLAREQEKVDCFIR